MRALMEKRISRQHWHTLGKKLSDKIKIKSGDAGGLRSEEITP